MHRQAYCLSLLCFAFLNPSRARGEEPFQSPAEVYSAMQANLRKSDYQGVCQCMTADSMEIFAWVTVIFAQRIKQQLAKELDKKRDVTPESIEAVFAAHGLSEEKINRAILLSLLKPADERPKVFKTALQDVPNKPRLIVEMYLELRKLKSDLSQMDTMNVLGWMKPDFVDLQFQDDAATAQVPQPEPAKQKTRTVHFRKSGSGWLIHVPMDL